LVECKMSYIISITCIQSIYTSDGYYQNLSSTATNSLIYCKNKKCKVIEVDNRLYWNNSNNEIIRCSAQFCNTYKLGQSCNDHPNEIISLWSTDIKFCNFYEQVSLNVGGCYILKDININYTFPEMKNGKDTIVLNIDSNSLVQYTNPEGKK